MEIERKLGESKRAIMRQNMQLGTFVLALLKQVRPELHEQLHEAHMEVDGPESHSAVADACRGLVDDLLNPTNAGRDATESSGAESATSNLEVSRHQQAVATATLDEPCFDGHDRMPSQRDSTAEELHEASSNTPMRTSSVVKTPTLVIAPAPNVCGSVQDGLEDRRPERPQTHKPAETQLGAPRTFAVNSMAKIKAATSENDLGRAVTGLAEFRLVLPGLAV